MSKVSDDTKEMLESAEKQDDDEGYHVYFDQALEAKLMELDPEWMQEMSELYEKSGMSRWYA